MSGANLVKNAKACVFRSLVCLTLFVGAQGTAANRHEHLLLLPSFRDIWMAFHLYVNPGATLDTVTANTSALADVRASTLAGRDPMIVRIAELFGQPIANRVRNNAVFSAPNATFGQVVDVLAAAIEPGRAAAIRETVMATFFEMTPYSHTDGNIAYRVQDSMRSNLIQRVISVDGMTRAAVLWGEILTRYAQRTALPDRMAFSFTVPHNLFNPEIARATSRALAPAVCEFFMTLPRKFIEGDGNKPGQRALLARDLDRLRTAIREGWAHGLDLTGSVGEPTDWRRFREYAHLPFMTLREASDRAALVDGAIRDLRAGREVGLGVLLRAFPEAIPPDILLPGAASPPRYPDDFRDPDRLADVLDRRTLQALTREVPADYAEKASLMDHLRFIFDELGKMDGQLRIHLYERVRDGHMYRALKTLLDEVVAGTSRLRLPTRIRIGHIARMSPEDIAYFARVARTPALQDRLIFEASPICNVRVGGATPQMLRDSIRGLLRAGLRVVVGSDGQGNFGDASRYLATLDYLKNTCGLTDAEIAQIHRNTMDTIDIDALRAHFGPRITANEVRDLDLFRIIHEDCSTGLARLGRARVASASGSGTR